MNLSHQKFPEVVTSTVDGKLRNKMDNSRAICICKVGNMKLKASIGFMITLMISIVLIIIFMCLNKTPNVQ